jgi:hypothetical protein
VRLLGLCCVPAAPSVARADLINGGFDAYPQAANSYADYTDSTYAGWRTTEGDHQIEVGHRVPGRCLLSGQQFR